MKRQCLIVAAFVLAWVLSGPAAWADIVNPSFETGDMTGWEVPWEGEFLVADDGGSDGTFYLRVVPDWSFLPNQNEWYWQAQAYQHTITIPSWATTFSVDIRDNGLDLAHCGVSLSRDEPSHFYRSAKYGSTSPAPNGFTRYTVDVSPYAGFEGAVITIIVGLYAAECPEDPVPFEVDNFLFAPEPATLAVVIDVKPGSDVNPINLKSKGLLPVAIFGDEEFDVQNIDLMSLVLAGASPKQKGKNDRLGAFEYINDDSFLDLILHFPIGDLDIGTEATEALLSGFLLDGTRIQGADVINLVGPLADVGLVLSEIESAGSMVIPEPATAVLLVLGSVALVSRRRRGAA